MDHLLLEENERKEALEKQATLAQSKKMTKQNIRYIDSAGEEHSHQPGNTSSSNFKSSSQKTGDKEAALSGSIGKTGTGALLNQYPPKDHSLSVIQEVVASDRQAKEQLISNQQQQL